MRACGDAASEQAELGRWEGTHETPGEGRQECWAAEELNAGRR